MFQQFYEPHSALKGFVNNIMIHAVKVEADQQVHRFSIPPLPEHGMIFYVRDVPGSETISTKTKATVPCCLIVGPQVLGHTIMPGRDHTIIKVGFEPGGLYRLLGIPMKELLCQDGFDGIELLGNQVSEINDKLQHAVSFFEMKMIVESFLLKQVDRLKQSLSIDQVLGLLIKERGLINIDQLASHACLSIRQFERVFQQRIGLAPKYFSRQVRFAQAWFLKEQQPGISWIKIAYECGYFDQMHLIRDFREFAGVNPSAIKAGLWDMQPKFFNEQPA